MKIRKSHKLKTLSKYFVALLSGNKTFEVRKNDRDFQVGDLLCLEEYDSIKDTFTGAYIIYQITYILNDPEFCKEGYVILGINLIN